MLRPERMSRVSVTGAKTVMDEVIETVHDLNLLHLTEYDGGWEGFEPGDPVEGADEASSKLVTVRSLKTILGVTAEDAGPSNRLVTDDALDDQLEEIRREVNELDDRRDEFRDELRSVTERIDTMEPFVRLGIPLELLQDYDTLAVRVGTGDAGTVERTLGESEIDRYRVESADGVVAVFAYADEETLQEILVDATFTALDVPDGEGEPEEYLAELEHRKQQLESKLDTVEDELEDKRLEVAGFLLAVEEKLSIDVQKREAPLTFATTKNAFVAEGWIPTDRYEDLVTALEHAVDDHVEVDELERAEYEEGHAHHVEAGEDHPGEDHAGGDTTAADGGTEPTAASDDEEREAATDGGHADDGLLSMGDGGPPVIMKNPGGAKPFELLTKVIGRPKYSEFDPTMILLLTFPIMFGFMIGDVGYGLLYMLAGLGIMRAFDSEGWKALGGIAVWAGFFTVIFGVLYGEIFGLHTVSDVLWGGNSPLHKGLQPAEVEFAQLWLVVAILAGIAHVSFGFVLGFIKEATHSVTHAVLEHGSWLLMLLGFWAFIFSDVAAGMKPAFLVGSEAALNGHPVPVGFAGFSETAGFVGIGMLVLGIAMVSRTEPAELIEAIFLKYFVDGLSYTRIAAVLLAKAGMAFTINLLFFGAYSHHGEFHFLIGKAPSAVTEGEVMFPGLMHLGAIGLIAGLVVLVVGHALVLALGITSAGLQAVRLEYVEFFGKFYEGGGDEYRPFGQERTFTANE
jgi:V/A-type H+-transporting ATPase subunit I